jgi:hypothetical protein
LPEHNLKTFAADTRIPVQCLHYRIYTAFSQEIIKPDFVTIAPPIKHWTQSGEDFSPGYRTRNGVNLAESSLIPNGKTCKLSLRAALGKETDGAAF